jgi:hypothetical protein
VDGNLDKAPGTTTIKLSRTAMISGDSVVEIESNASVFIEGQSGDTYALPETNIPGMYGSDNLTIDPTHNYRLVISTVSGKQYASDFVPYKKTPAIDSITWAVDRGNVNVQANAHDDADNTHYYLWKVVETWEYHARWHSGIRFENGQVLWRSPSEEVYWCWTTQPSPQIHLASTTHLARDIVSRHTLRSIPLSSIKFQTEYSVLVHQLAVTKSAFDYWQQVKKNTEDIGTIFGPQPSQIASNIHCITNPNEPVIGYFSASSVETERLYIFHAQVPLTTEITGYEACVADTLFLRDFQDFRGGSSLISEAYKGSSLVGYLKSTADCVDCRFHGGVTVRPDFWK